MWIRLGFLTAWIFLMNVGAIEVVLVAPGRTGATVIQAGSHVLPVSYGMEEAQSWGIWVCKRCELLSPFRGEFTH